MIRLYTTIDLLGNAFEIYIVNEFFKLIFGKQPLVKRHAKTIFGIALLLSSFFAVVIKDSPFITSFIALIVYFLLSYSYSNKILLRLSLSILLIAFFLAAEVISGIIIKNIFSINIGTIQKNVAYYIQGVLFSKFIVFVIVKLIGIREFKYLYPMSSKIPLMLSVFPVSSIFSICTIAAFTYDVVTFKIILLASISIIALILSNVIVFYVFERQNDLEQKNVRLEFVHDLLKLQKDHYIELYNTQEETRRVRHDMKNRLMAISGYLEAGEFKQAVNYIKKYSGEIQEAFDVIDTGCPAIDAILKAKLQKAAGSGARLTYKIILPENLFIDAIDLAVVLANGLDNAIEAIDKLQSPKIINLSIMPQQDYLVINIRNPIISNVDVNHLETNKHDPSEHGYGLKNIKLIAEKYSGDADIKSENSTFSLCVLLKNHTFAG